MLSWTKLPRCGVPLGHVALIVLIDANAQCENRDRSCAALVEALSQAKLNNADAVSVHSYDCACCRRRFSAPRDTGIGSLRKLSDGLPRK